MKNDLVGSAISVLLHGGLILLFTWCTLSPSQKKLTVIDLSLLNEQPQQCLPRPKEPAPPVMAQPKIEPRVMAPQPQAPAPEPAPPRPAEPQLQKVAASDSLVPVAAPKSDTAPVMPPSGVTSVPVRTATATATGVTAEDPVTRTEKARKHYLKEHFTYIRDSIVGKLSYPAIARKMGWTGTVKVTFCVCENGSVKDVKVINSSGFGVLDNNVVETIRRAAPFPKPPIMAEVIMPITYRLD